MLKFIFSAACGVGHVAMAAVGYGIASNYTDGNLIAGAVGAILGVTATEAALVGIGKMISPYGLKYNTLGTYAGLAIGAMMWMNGAFGQESNIQAPTPKAPIINAIKLKP